MYDGKYTYQRWRPVTAIRLADTDGNPLTDGRPELAPARRKHPGRPVVSRRTQHDQRRRSRRARELLRRPPALLGHLAGAPGVTRSFTSFSAAVQEAGLSRIYAGVHTRIDHVAGLQLGDAVAGFVLNNALLPATAASAGSAIGGARAVRPAPRSRRPRFDTTT